MAILIDGYNLLHASGILARGIGPGTLERARNALLNFLAESLLADELPRTVVVFDARSAPVGRPRIVAHRGLRVHFAPNPGDADALIEELILADHSPRKLVVVSSDHRLQRAAKRRKATPIDSDRWYAQIVRRRLQGPAEAEAAKPSHELSPDEVGFWLRQFQLPADQEVGAPGEKPTESAAETGPRIVKRQAEPADEKELPPWGEGIFPPGFGDELDDER